ncbi:PPE domain-containing protein [Mycobacterium sp.]|uniref:PPE domain-containing protein n=1 Tax=Mycobacterium sp. TaxID=1785 RepID=UPI0031E145A9
MTTPIWMAAPPEVHSALLSSGPGPGPLLAAAATWTSLSAEYASAADQLTALLGAMQAGAWDGPAAELYMAANAPYVAWLMQANADSAAVAAQYETAVAAYSAALVTMPTLAELAANHASHAVLVATNFFGINTIPIALNEADYVRMWVQAATVMGTYQAVAGTAVASAPRTTPAPRIVKSAATASDPSSNPGDSLAGVLDQLLTPFLNQLSAALNQLGLQLTVNPFAPLHPGTTPLSLILNDLQGMYEGIFVYGLPAILAAQTPTQFFAALFIVVAQGTIDTILAVIQFAVQYPLVLAAALPLLIAPLGAVGGFAGLAGLAAVSTVPAVAPAVPQLPLAVGLTPITPTVASSATAPAAVPVSVPAPTAAPAPAPPPPPGAFPYLVGGSSTGSGMSTRAKAQEPTHDRAAVPSTVAAAASIRDRAQTSRRRRAEVKQLGRGYECMDLDPELDLEPDASPHGTGRGTSVVTSTQGAGTLGFAGTTHAAAATEAAGLTTLAGDAFTGRLAMPMMPSTWDPDQPAKAGEGGDDG